MWQGAVVVRRRGASREQPAVTSYPGKPGYPRPRHRWGRPGLPNYIRRARVLSACNSRHALGAEFEKRAVQRHRQQRSICVAPIDLRQPTPSTPIRNQTVQDGWCLLLQHCWPASRRPHRSPPLMRWIDHGNGTANPGHRSPWAGWLPSSAAPTTPCRGPRRLLPRRPLRSMPRATTRPTSSSA